MLSKQYRLTKSKDFEKIVKFGQAVYGQELTIKWIKNNLSVSRFGLVISAKVAKKANIRNKIKRQLREIIRANLSISKSRGSTAMTIRPRYDIMILTKPKVIDLDYWQLKEKLEYLLKKAGLIKIV